jgi:hypothetical protein
MGRGAAAGFPAALAGVLVAATISVSAENTLAQTAATPDAEPATIATDAPRSASLSWVRLDGAGTCATAPEIAEGIARVLRRQALVPPAREATAIEARVERTPGKKRFRVTIDISGGDGRVQGTRHLESPGDDCRKLDEPAALAIALMIDPDAALRPPAPPVPQPTIAIRRDVLLVPVPVIVEVPVAAPPPAPPREWPESPELTLAVGPSVALGIIPGPAAGMRLGVEFGPPASLESGDGVAVGPSSVRLGFAAYSGAIEIEPTSGSRSASLEMVALLPHLALCPTTLWIGERTAFAACLALDVGAVSWLGTGFDTPDIEGLDAYVDVGAVAQARFVIAEPLALELRGAAVAPLVRDRYVFRAADGTPTTAYEPGAVGAMLDAALAIGLDL